MMRIFQYWFTLPRLLIYIVFIAIFTMAVRVPADSDTWWHLRSGQYSVENRAIFSADPFSFTHQGQVWLYPKLGQVFLYSVFALGGWGGLSLALAALVTAAFGLVWPVTPGNLYMRALAVIVGALTSALTWVARPQMLSFVLAGGVLWLLERYKRTGWRGVYLLPLITVVWVNVHGGYAVAFMLLAAYLLGETVNRLTRHTADPVLSWRQIGLLAAVGVVSLAAVGVNPYGWQMWLYPFRTVGIDALRDFIQEWRSPDFHTSMTWPFVAMLLLTLTAMGMAGRQADWTDLAVVGLWAASSLLAARNIGLYGLLTVPMLARYGDAAWGRYLPGGQVGRARWPVLSYVNWVLAGLVTLAALARIIVTVSPLSTTTVAQEKLPVAAVEFVQQRHPTGPLFNSYNWGGYLLFTLWPEYRVYIDGRTDLYEDAFIRRYLKVMVAGDGWQETLDRDGINLALIENNSILAKFLQTDPAWRELYRDNMAVIFARKIPLP